MSQDKKGLYPDGTRWVMASNVSRSAAVAIARPERAGRPDAAWWRMAANACRSAAVAVASNATLKWVPFSPGNLENRPPTPAFKKAK